MMRIAVIYAGRDSQSESLRETASQFAKAFESNGYSADIFNAYRDSAILTPYDFVVIGCESISVLSAKVPGSIRKFLSSAGTVSGKRCLAFVYKGIRKQKTLSNLMNAMESEGMILKLSESISKSTEAFAIAKKIVF